MRGMRRSVRKKVGWGVMIVGIQLCVLCLCQTGVKHVITDRYEKLLAEKQAKLEAAGRMVYVTKKEVRAGETFTETNIEKKYVLSEQDTGVLNVEAIGMTACVDLPVGIILNTSVCSGAEYGLSDRRCTFQGICFAENFEIYDEVDVRIRYGNGENYCVLKNKRLLPTQQEEECCLILSETEQLLMSGAGYDAEVYDGAELYLVGVMNAWEEEHDISMFIPPEQVLLQLRELNEYNGAEFFGKAWSELREELELRLREYERQSRDGLL